MAISTTLFLFIHTRDLNTRLREMEVKLQPEDMVAANQMVSGRLFTLINMYIIILVVLSYNNNNYSKYGVQFPS